MLRETAKNKAAALDEYTTLQTQIKTREELIGTLEQEVELVASRIDRDDEVIQAMQNDMATLKGEYEALLRRAFRHKLNHSTLWFLLSSDSFNQALQRWRYIKQYEKYRKQQAVLILETQKSISNKLEALQEQRKEKEVLLLSQKDQQKELAVELERRNRILRSLRRDEKKLRTNLKNKRAAHEQLNQAIEKVIIAEMADRRKESRTADALKPSTNNASNSTSLSRPEVRDETTANFKRNRGKLHWPVEKGVITRWFGEQQHPTLPKVKIRNNGIDIRTENNAIVRAVFDGEVASRQFVPGYNNMLIIRHGNYYTVYSNLDVLFVEKGDRINARQHIGRVAVNQESNQSQLHFEVWHDKIRLNPSDWIKK